ncbi:MAG: 3-deoxy-8-phosphooctulonate synthase, partial [Flavobacteriales bacterium]|nr:3-deoxy-8-phosphooctulonate synthase [Flavobacteriales bacterium]MBT4201563.1 3-deoxy-8-phosphooctulonate synthase [Flavobacteriales bacterium]MBT7382315.1 3-deoxy-8-phosphooctulonate synthase [Flavobacteriales bacterium]
PASEVVDVLQIPAYLCMQTSLVLAAAKTGKVINVKHGQFLAPENMSKVCVKITSTGNEQILLTERGYSFGYNDLVVDPRAFYHMRETGYPVIFDATHSIRKYGIPSADPSGGAKQYLDVLTRSAVGAGVDGLFIEAHPCPSEALCDAASQMNINELGEFLKPMIAIHAAGKAC